MTSRRATIILGVSCLLSVFLVNEWSLAFLFSPHGHIDSISRCMVIRICGGSLLVFGAVSTFWPDRIRLSLVALVLLGIVLALGLGELTLRLARRSDPNLINHAGETRYVSSSDFHHAYRPDEVFTRYPTRWDEFSPVEIQVNSLGMRGAEVPVKEPGEERTILLGDSFLEADEIEENVTAAAWLTRDFSTRRRRFLQHGVSSWSPLLEWNWLLKVGLKLQPDRVILFLFVNDFYSHYAHGDVAYTRETEFDEDGNPVSFKTALFGDYVRNPKKGWAWPGLLNMLDDAYWFTRKATQIPQHDLDTLLATSNPQFEMFLEQLVPRPMKESGTIRDTLRLSRPRSLWDEQTVSDVEVSLGYLRRIRTLLNRRRIDFVITVVPAPWNISREESPLARRYDAFGECTVPMGGLEEVIRGFCRREGIRYLDLSGALFEASKRGKHHLYLNYDGHWSPEGHRVVADAISNFLK